MRSLGPFGARFNVTLGVISERSKRTPPFSKNSGKGVLLSPGIHEASSGPQEDPYPRRGHGSHGSSNLGILLGTAFLRVDADDVASSVLSSLSLGADSAVVAMVLKKAFFSFCVFNLMLYDHESTRPTI